MEKYKILIIEDDPIIQTELQVLLNGNGSVSYTHLRAHET